jgi:glycosyltransferase involved in cell wall biosynthesis
VRSPPRLPKRRSPPPANERFLTAVLVGPRAPLAIETLAPFWRLAAALEPCVARVILLDRGGAADGGNLLPGVERRAVDPEQPWAELLAAMLAGVPAAERRVVAVATPELASWAGDEIESADAYAARVVARFAATSGRLVEGSDLRVEPGVVLAAADRLDDLPALLAEEPGRELASAPFDLRALRRLRDLGVPPAEVTAELVAGLGGVRGLLERSGLRRGLRLAVDRIELPSTVGAAAALRVVVEGWIVDLPPVRRLALKIGDRRYPFPVEVDREDVAGRVPFLPDVRCGFRIAGRFGPLPPGTHEVALERLDGRRLRRLGRVEVLPAAAGSGAPSGAGILRVTRCEARAADGELRLELAGELDGGETVDSLRVEIDGRKAFDVDRRHLVHEAGTGSTAWLSFRVAEPVALAAGERTVRVSARRADRSLGDWSGRVVAPAPASERADLSCPELERLVRDAPAPVWGVLRLAGDASGWEPGDEVETWIDGRRCASTRLDGDGRFASGVENLELGARQVEMRLVRDGRSLARRGPATIAVRSVETPPRWPGEIERLLAALGERAGWLREISPRQLARQLAAEAVESLGQIDAALGELARRIEGGERRPSRVADAVGLPPARPLRVLFASWEIPWSGHGGGICMVNLLGELGARHEITLVHPVAPGEEGLSEEVRPHVREIVTVPRGWQRPTELSPFGTPERYLWTFSRELRRALAAEMASGRYDVANLEYEGLFLHSAGRAPVPRLFVAHDLPSFGALAETANTKDPESSAGARLAGIVAALSFDAIEVPDRFERLATLTEPEARHLLPFLAGRTVEVLPIPVDLERLGSHTVAREPASFLFVGTFRHPPNRAAAEELIDVVAPRLRARLPGAVVRLAGADPPPALVDRAAAASVELLGWVDDLPALLARSTGFLAPLRHGAGMRVKLLEAMAAGCPVVSTGLGMSGIAAPPGEAYLRAESAEEVVGAAVALAAAPERGAALAAAARAVVERDHGIAAQAERRERIWATMLAGETES